MSTSDIPSVSTQPHVVTAVAPDDNDDVLALASARAKWWKLPLLLCSVVGDAGDREAAELALARRVQALLPSDTDVTTEVRVGDRVEQILACANERHAVLLVLGQAHQREGLLARIFSPSVPTAVMRAAPCPVLLARGTHGTNRILVATHLGDPTWPTLRAAAAEVARTGGDVTVLHCIEPMAVIASADFPVPLDPHTDEAEAGAMQQLERAAREAGLVGATLRVELGPSGTTILEHAKALAADLIVVGTHGRSGARRLLLGSTAEEVVRDATCDVMVVRLHEPGAVTPEEA
jgi:universal stress protein E